MRRLTGGFLVVVLKAGERRRMVPAGRGRILILAGTFFGPRCELDVRPAASRFAVL